MKTKKIVALLLTLAMLATSVAVTGVVSAEESYIDLTEVVGANATPEIVYNKYNNADTKIELGHGSCQGISRFDTDDLTNNTVLNFVDVTDAYAAMPDEPVADYTFDVGASANGTTGETYAEMGIKVAVPEDATVLSGVIGICNRYADGNRNNKNNSGNGYYMDNGGNTMSVYAYDEEADNKCGALLGATDPLCKGLDYDSEADFLADFPLDNYSEEIQADLALTDTYGAVYAREFSINVTGQDFITIVVSAGRNNYFDHVTLFNTQFTVDAELAADDVQFISINSVDYEHVTKLRTDCDNAHTYNNASAVLGLSTSLTLADADFKVTPCIDGERTDTNGVGLNPLANAYHIVEVDVPAGATAFTTTVAICDGRVKNAANDASIKDDTFQYILTALDADGNPIEGESYSDDTGVFTVSIDDAADVGHAKVLTIDIPEGAETVKINLQTGNYSRWDHLALFNSGFSVTVSGVDKVDAKLFTDKLDKITAMEDVKAMPEALAAAQAEYELLDASVQLIAADALEDLAAFVSDKVQTAAAAASYVPFEAETAILNDYEYVRSALPDLRYGNNIAGVQAFANEDTIDFTVYADKAGAYYMGIVYLHASDKFFTIDVTVADDAGNETTFYGTDGLPSSGSWITSVNATAANTRTNYRIINLNEGKNVVTLSKGAISQVALPHLDKILIEDVDDAISNFKLDVNTAEIQDGTASWSASIGKDDMGDKNFKRVNADPASNTGWTANYDFISTELFRINDDLSATVDYGVVYGVDEAEVEAAVEFDADGKAVVGGKTVAKKVAFGTDKNGDIARTFGVKMINLPDDAKPVVKFYVTYADTAGVQHTVYSDAVSAVAADIEGN